MIHPQLQPDTRRIVVASFTERQRLSEDADGKPAAESKASLSPKILT